MYRGRFLIADKYNYIELVYLLLIVTTILFRIIIITSLQYLYAWWWLMWTAETHSNIEWKSYIQDLCSYVYRIIKNSTWLKQWFLPHCKYAASSSQIAVLWEHYEAPTYTAWYRWDWAAVNWKALHGGFLRCIECRGQVGSATDLYSETPVSDLGRKRCSADRFSWCHPHQYSQSTRWVNRWRLRV
jgi:hypothetical protein